MQVKQCEEALSRKQLLSEIYGLDLQAREACINFLIEQYPALSREQSGKLVHLIFDNNFKVQLPNHFGRIHNRGNFGYPFIWLLNELQVGGIKYLYQNKIWQIHWDVSGRHEGYTGRGDSQTIGRGQLKTVKFLVTTSLVGDERQLWEKYGLVFFAYGLPSPIPSTWQYPFSEDVDLSGDTDFLISLKLASSDCSNVTC